MVEGNNEAKPTHKQHSRKLGLACDCNQNMAVEFITPFSVFLFFLSSCQAKPENFSEAQCKVLTVEEGTASQFLVKASKRGVRIVYLDLKFRNDSYRPSESENEFLPNRWVWASLISEPMLSLSYDYDILSVGLLKYQTRSMGCCWKINQADAMRT